MRVTHDEKGDVIFDLTQPEKLPEEIFENSRLDLSTKEDSLSFITNYINTLIRICFS
jgi:hypothetical protein